MGSKGSKEEAAGEGGENEIELTEEMVQEYKMAVSCAHVVLIMKRGNIVNISAAMMRDLTHHIAHWVFYKYAMGFLDFLLKDVA